MRVNRILIIISLLFILIASVGFVSASDLDSDMSFVSVNDVDTGIIVNDINVNDISQDDNDSDFNVLKEDPVDGDTGGEEPVVPMTKRFMNMNFTGMEYSVEYGKGFPVTVTSTNSNLTGVLTYILDDEIYVNTTFNNGISGVILQGLNVGYHNISVFYHDDVNYMDYFMSYEFRIIRADMSGLTLSVFDQKNFSYINIFYGDPVCVEVRFKHKDYGEYLSESGILSFSLDNVTWFNETFTDGRVYHIFDNLSAGNYTVYIKYSGDNNYRNGSGSTTFEVLKKSLDVNIPDVVYVEEGLKLNLKSGMTGFIEIVDIVDGYSKRIDLANINEDGKLLISFANFTFGNHEINLRYDGDNNFNPFNVYSTIDVQSNKLNTAISAKDLSIYAFNRDNLTLTLKDVNGNVLAGKKVVITLNGKDYTQTTDANGQAKLSVGSSYVKTYTATIKFAGDDSYNESSATVKIVVKTPYVTVNDIIKASNYLRVYANKYKKLPSTIRVGSISCSQAQLVYLMTVAIKKINAKSKLTANVKVINVKTAGTYNAKVSTKLTKKSYLSLVNTLYTQGAKGTLPKYIKSGKVIGYNVYAFSLANILMYYNVKKTLPSSSVFKNY